MNHDLYVLRALARLSRRGKAVDCDSLAIRAGGSEEDVRASLRRLSRAALIDRSGMSVGALAAGREVRITLAGLAVAVASSKMPATKPRAGETGESGSRVEGMETGARIDEEPVHVRRSASRTRAA